MGAKVSITQGEMKFYLNEKLRMEAELNASNLYELKLRRSLIAEGNTVESDLKVWHERLGHPCLKRMRNMADTNQLKITIPAETKLFCEACIFGKSSKKSFKKNQRRDYLAGEFLHSDVNGPMSMETYGGNRWFVTFIDDATGITFVFFLKTKDEVFDKFKMVVNLIKTQLGREVKVLRTDNSREYVNGKMKTFIEDHGIEHQRTAPNTPEQNGVAERKNRTLVESTRSMLFAKDLPLQLWAEAVLTATYLSNRQPSTRSGEKSAYELWFNHKPELSHLRIFGSWAYEHVPDNLRKKLQKKAKKLLMVGYDSNSTNYRLLDMRTKKITISRHVDFNEEMNEKGETKKY